VIGRYQRAHDARDTALAITAFSPDAEVIDDGHTYVGTERVRWWLDNAASEFEYTRHLTGFEKADDGVYVVHNRVVGNFPGGEVDLDYRFELAGELIQRLEITP
jgi:hypothetical protein